MATLILLALFALVVVISAIVGLVRGLNKSVIRLMTLVVAVLLTFLIAAPVTNLIADSIVIEGQTLGQMILNSVTGDPMMAGILDSVPLLREAILVAPAFVMSIVVFPVVFLVLRFLTWIGFLFAQKPLRKLIFKDNCDKEEAAAKPTGFRVGMRFAGMGVGIVTGMIIFGMLVTPLLGVFGVLPPAKTMNDTMDAMAEQGMLTAQDAALIGEIYGVTDNGLVNFYGFFGGKATGKAYLSAVSKIEANGYTSSLADELGTLLGAVQTAMDSGLQDVLAVMDDPNALYALLTDKDMVDSLLQNVFQSKILVAAVPELLAGAMEGVAAGMNVPANKDAVYDNMMDAVAKAVQESGIDFESIKAYEDANNIVHSLVGALSFGTPAPRAQALSQAEYEAQIEKLVQLAADISKILNKSLSGDNAAFTDSVANQIVNDIKIQAGENGQAVVDNFNAAGVQDALAKVDTSAMETGNADQLLEQLTDKEKFETDVTTVETIKASIVESVKAAVEDEEKAAETASTLASVVTTLADVVSTATTEDGSFDPAKLDFEKLAGAVTELQNSNLKDVGSSLLDVVVSGDLGGNEIVSNALGAIKEGYDQGADIGGTISSVGALVNLGTAMGGDGGEEAMVDSLTSLIDNLNDFTIGLLPSILSDDTIASMGIPMEYAKATFNVIETLLKELMKLKGAEDYTNEVKSIQSLYTVVTSGAGSFSEADIVGLVDYAKQSDAIFNTLVSISDANPFGVTYPDQASQDYVAGIIEGYYAESGKTEREQQICQAIAGLLGIDKELNLG